MPKLPFFSIKNAPKFAKAVGGKLKDIAYLPTSLETVEKIDMRFDPWRKDSSSIKQVWTQLCSEKTRQTNQFCLITHSVLSDNSESILSLTYSNGQILEIETANLKYIEIMYHINKMNYEIEMSKVKEQEALI